MLSPACGPGAQMYFINAISHNESRRFGQRSPFNDDINAAVIQRQQWPAMTIF